ncbi:rap guanine nucleotide exchange factor 5b isoform X2 [Megalobrama amblycephala]|uniref:rap guanine nucleotide exchange factor 5b isoform X2 n=1 Tax=Megalobrama amblycephala TaxID=75352 RepID=UPI002013C970|nr:rap guanine nucleotide exchange factor 5b isoform X2 [Megalobrama amblycephala]
MDVVDESPSVKALISKVFENHKSSRTDSSLLLKNGSQFKKNLEAIISQKQPPESIRCSNAGQSRHKACVNNVPCAGRALRNAFLSNGQDNWKAHIKLARIIRRTCTGLELVEWLMDRFAFIQNREIASKIWNILLDLGILLSVEQNNVFEDSRSLYQFTFEECEAQSCDFRNQVNWPSAVHLLLQLVPYVQLRSGTHKRNQEDAQKTSDACNPLLQMRALEHLTSTVQNELLATLARKAQTKSMMEESSPEHNTNTPGPSPSPAVCKQGPGAGTRDREDISRLEMVQRLAKDGCRLLHSPLKAAERPAEPPSDAAVRVCERERSHEVLLPQRTTSPRAPSSSSCSWTGRYAAVPATPEKVLEHLLDHLRLDEEQKSPQSRETESLLDDFLLTYPVFMSTSDLCQALLGHYCSKKGRMKEEGRDTLLRKRKVLHLLSQWSSLCTDLPQDDEHAKLFLKTLYRYVLDDLYEFPSLEKDLKELQKLLRMQRRHTVDESSPQKKNKALFHQLSLKENWHPVRGAQRDRKEVLCRVYVTIDSYVSVRTHSEVSVQELLRTVAERLDCAEDDMVLMAVAYPGEKVLLQSDQCVFSSSLSAAERLLVCRRDLTEIMSPFTDNGQQHSVKMLSMNTWDVALSLTNCDWSLFTNVHEQELVHFTLSRDASAGHTVALEQLLQRCNETQQWVMTEVLLCPTLCKRVQLFKKFIKIAAHCKAQRNLNSFFAIIMGLNSPAVSRLTQTWEKVPGKFRKLFSELESLTDPSLNHKAYRDAFRKMKSPKIPFLPLLLKDITFIHEGNKTFLDNLVNFDKLHMIADTVRIIRQCRTDHMGNMLSQKDSMEVRTYINYLHVIDNQQTLFELSHRLEPRT